MNKNLQGSKGFSQSRLAPSNLCAGHLPRVGPKRLQNKKASELGGQYERRCGLCDGDSTVGLEGLTKSFFHLLVSFCLLQHTLCFTIGIWETEDVPTTVHGHVGLSQSMQAEPLNPIMAIIQLVTK